MKRVLLSSLLTVGLIFVGSGNAFAQRHGGGEGRGGGVGPAVRSESPAVRNDAPGVRNDAAFGNGERGAHPFYGNDRAGVNDWRYGFNDNRWWYWTALGTWAYWDNGRWNDYAQPYTTYYNGPTAASAAPSGYYWSNDQHQWYWFNGTTLQPAPQQ